MPSTGLQAAERGHSHSFSQFTPYQPSGHAGTDTQTHNPTPQHDHTHTPRQSYFQQTTSRRKKHPREHRCYRCTVGCQLEFPQHDQFTSDVLSVDLDFNFLNRVVCTCLHDATVAAIVGATGRTSVIAKFRYTGPTGPDDQTKSADFVGDPGLRPGSREKVRSGPVGSG